MPVIISGSQGTTTISGSGVSGSLTVTGSLIVSGSNTITNYGAFTSNEAGGDFDFRVESSGEPNMLFVNGGTNRVGIGTQAPGASLHVSSSGDAALLQVDGATNGTVLFVTGSGRVGIGTSTPGSLFEISAADNEMNEGFVLFNRGGANGDSTGIYLKHYDGRAESFITDALDATWGTKLQFGTSLSTNESGIRMTLDKSGSLGIGTQSPTALLHVSSSNDAITGSLLQIDSKDLGPVLFVTGSGRVGIGTATPNSTFQVSGSQAGKYTVISGSMTLDETHYIADLTGAIAATVTLPAASGVTGRTYHILTTYQGDEVLTITGSGGQFMGSSQQAGPEEEIGITGSAQSVTLVSTGAYWFILTDNRQQQEGGGGD
jgi:hypothetical protein